MRGQPLPPRIAGRKRRRRVRRPPQDAHDDQSEDGYSDRLVHIDDRPNPSRQANNPHRGQTAVLTTIRHAISQWSKIAVREYLEKHG